ncbi:phosphodiesterase [Shimia abyssi]|uniref:3',5'-cyclic AMP phosphodiesterase CpdA n=1 Tax=Shimia abyssi TaxID=1662395 RepID=A0A2P8FG47_9RHOB|nr:phosphodiesterase [Shimia abyssi]PSL20685.1 3',5'-cyclic AMP phosphodiesterase CpdA [Shimia abyssi]
MTKLIWMTDPHFQTEGTIRGLNPRTRLEAAIEHANTHHADAALIVLSGDLVGDDIERDYQSLAIHLNASAIPFYPMMGNHDDRPALRRNLTLPETTTSEFVQFVVELPDCTILCLDTHKPGSDAGTYCATRLAWLDDVLTHSADKPAYIFMHHPPLALHLPKQDEIMLEEADSLLGLLARHNHVKHLFAGHVHRPTAGTVRGIPFATLGALSIQAPPPRPEWDWNSFEPAQEPPHYGVLHIEDDSVVLQYTQFCKYDVGVRN